MKRVLAVLFVVLGLFIAAPADAKPKYSGSYNLHLQPDPSPDAFNTAGMNKCQNLNPNAVDKHNVKVPLTSKLTVTVDSPDPTGKGVTDWDAYLLDAKGNILASGTTGTSHEVMVAKVTKGSTVTIVVCNVAGNQDGTVEYSGK